MLLGSKVLKGSLAADPALTLQGLEPQLGEVVKSLKQAWGVEYIYAWHGLPAYWAGVAVGESHHCCQAAPFALPLAPASLCCVTIMQCCTSRTSLLDQLSIRALLALFDPVPQHAGAALRAAACCWSLTASEGR